MIVEINERQVARVAKILKELPEEGIGLNFYSFQDAICDDARLWQMVYRTKNFSFGDCYFG